MLSFRLSPFSFYQRIADGTLCPFIYQPRASSDEPENGRIWTQARPARPRDLIQRRNDKGEADLVFLGAPSVGDTCSFISLVYHVQRFPRATRQRQLAA